MNEKKASFERDFTFSEWENLSEDLKGKVIAQYWNPYRPEIGMNTKKNLVEAFQEHLKVDFQQIGIGYFGWGIWMLYVIIENSRIRIPRNFAHMPVNKGIIKENLGKNKVRVKYGYGGINEVDLSKKMIIK